MVEAATAAIWHCPNCGTVPPEHVTFEETHDPRHGGCGEAVEPYEAQPHPLDGKFEPEARDVKTSPADAALVSIAVSLKRIADAVAGNGASQGIDLSLFYISETLQRRGA
jgi:hypothetical protein